MRNKGGRNPAQIDWDEVERYLMAGCSGTDVASRLGVHPETLYRRCEKDNKVGFSEYLRQKRECGAVLLKVAQFDEAVRKRNTSMLIWLGKQMLGQSDKAHIENGGNPMVVQVVSFNGKPLVPWKESNEGREILECERCD